MHHPFAHPLTLSAAELLAERLVKANPELEPTVLSTLRIWKQLARAGSVVDFCEYLDAALGLPKHTTARNGIKQSEIPAVDLLALDLNLPSRPLIEELPILVLHEAKGEMTLAHCVPHLEKVVGHYFPSYAAWVYCPPAAFLDVIQNLENRMLPGGEKGKTEPGEPLLHLKELPTPEVPANGGIPKGVHLLGTVLDGLTFTCKKPLTGKERWALGNSFKNLYRLHFINVEIEGTEAKKAKTGTALERLIENAGDRNATDIHIDTQEQRVQVNLRVESKLEPYPGKIEGEALLEEIKRYAENKPFNDGIIETKTYRARYNYTETRWGPKMTIRLIPKLTPRRSLLDLGFDKQSAEIFNHFLNGPDGLILVGGPTGSGKSTTLCQALSSINPQRWKVVTVEDPVEQIIPGALQTEVSKNMTFADFLRKMMRTDPDYIMVGEMRDPESLQSAVQASLTGHIVLSTHHSSSIPKTLEWLKDTIAGNQHMLPEALKLLVNQRLAPKPCPHCRAAKPMDKELWRALSEEVPWQKNLFMFEAKGCDRCNKSGTKGRTLITEILIVTEEIRDYLLGKKTWDEVKDCCYRIEDFLPYRTNSRETYQYKPLLAQAAMRCLGGNCTPQFAQSLLPIKPIK